jgi:hypothetical protein
VLAAEHQRRQQAQHVGVGAGAGEDAAAEQPGDHLLGGHRRAHADEEALAVHAHHGADAAGGAEVGRHLAHPIEDRPLLEGVERGDDHGAGERAAAEGAAEGADADAGDDLGAGQHGARGEAAGHALRHGEQVRRHAVELGGEGVAGAPHAGLHLVEDQLRTGRAGQLAGRGEVVAPQLEGARHSLHRFDDEGRDVVAERGVEGGDVTARHEGHVERRLREGVAVLAPRHRRGRGGAPVEGALERHDTTPAGLAQRQHQRVLVGLGAGVDEEDVVEPGGGEGREARRRVLADLQRQDVALEQQRRALALERRDQAWVGVPEHGDGMPAPEVEHAAPALVPQPHPLPVDGGEGELVVDGQQRRGGPRCRLGGDLWHAPAPRGVRRPRGGHVAPRARTVRQVLDRLAGGGVGRRARHLGWFRVFVVALHRGVLRSILVAVRPSRGRA